MTYGVKGLLSYDPQTGLLTWTRKRRKVVAGSVAGYVRKDGRYVVSVDGREHQAHRVAWFLTYGVWPDGDIDHINGDPTDNRLCNLRVATRSQNLGNAKLYASNSTGYRGVYKSGSRYAASIQARKIVYRLGTFDTALEAAEAYRAASERLFGEFSRAAQEAGSPCFTAVQVSRNPENTGECA